MPNAFDQSGASSVKIGSSLAVSPSAPSYSVSASSASARGEAALGKAVSGLSDMFDRISLPYDQAAGAKSVTRDEEGNVKVGWRLAFTANDTAYNQAATQAGLSEMRNSVEQDMQALRIQHDGNPEAFSKAAAQYTKTLGKKADPLLQPHIVADAERIGSQHFQSLTQKNFQLDNQRNMESLQYRRKGAAEELEALALQGGTDTDEFKAKWAEYQSTGAALVANKNFGVTQEQADYEAQHLDGKIKTNVAVGLTREVLQKEGPDAARAFVTKHFDDPALGMTARDRNSARNLAMAEINSTVKQNTGDRRILREDIGLLKKRYESGEDISQDEVNEHLNRAASLGDTVSARNVITMSTTAEAAKMFKNAPTLQDKAAIVRGLTPSGGMHPGFVGAVIAQESSGNASAQSGAGAAGLMQIMPGTAREIAEKTGITDLSGKSDTEVQAWLKANPEQNVKMGTFYLNQQFQAFGGDHEAALVAYNAGAKVAQAWVAGGKNDSLLPAETRNYKEKIMGNLAMGPAPTGPIIANNRMITGSTSYLDFARQHLGFGGADPSQRAALSNFIKQCAGINIDPAKTPWCAAYVNGILGAAGTKGNGSMRAMNFLKYGEATQQPVSGDIVVFDWKNGSGHVGFVEGMEERDGKMFVKVLGGNQGNKVSSQWFSMDNVAGFRRPPPAGVGPEHALPVTANTSDGGRQYAYADAAMASAVRKEAAAYVNLHLSTFEETIKKGVVPDGEEVQALIDMVAFGGDKKAIERVRTLIGAADAGSQIAGLTPALQKKLLDDLDQKEAQGTTLAMREYNDILRANAKASIKAWEDDPMAAAGKYGDVKLADIDWSNPESIAARAKQAGSVAAQRGLPAFVPFTKGEIGMLTSHIAASDGQAAQAVLSSLNKALPAEQFAALMQNKDLQKSIVGLSQSDDPQKMSAAYSVLDAEYQRDPMHFSERFGGRTEANLYLWQDKRQYMTPEAMMKEMRRANDPAEKARQDARKTEAREAIKKLTVNDAVKALDPSWFFRASAPAAVSVNNQAIDMPGLLMTEYKRQYETAYIDTGSPEVAQRLAAERLKKVWGKSDANGGEMMRRAPELYYQPVEGKHDYIKEQFDRDVKAAMLDKFGKTEAPGKEGLVLRHQYGGGTVDAPDLNAKVTKADQATDTGQKTFNALINAPKKMVADHHTEADIAAGRPPSYAVVVKYSDGTYDTLLNKEGKPLRFAADPQEAVAQNTAKVESRQALALQNRQIMAGAIDNQNAMGGLPY